MGPGQVIMIGPPGGASVEYVAHSENGDGGKTSSTPTIKFVNRSPANNEIDTVNDRNNKITSFIVVNLMPCFKNW